MFSIGINRDVGVIENNILLLCHKLLLFIHVTKTTHLREQKLNLYSIMCHHKKHDITHFVCCFYWICKKCCFTRIRWLLLSNLKTILLSCRGSECIRYFWRFAWLWIYLYILSGIYHEDKYHRTINKVMI